MSSDSSPIELRIRGINGGQQTLTVRTTSKFNKIKVIYCATVGLVPSQLRLLYDGIPIPDYPTPKMLEIKGGDIVETEREFTVHPALVNTVCRVRPATRPIQASFTNRVQRLRPYQYCDPRN